MEHGGAVMRTLNKIKIAFVLALTAILMFSAFAFSNIGNAKADEIEFVGDGKETFVMREDAEMRLYAEEENNTSGLRFTVDIGSKLYDEKISTLEEIYFVIGYAENFDALEAEEGFDGSYAGVKGKKVSVPVANVFKAMTAGDTAYTGAYRANVVISNIQDANYDKEFTAVAYYMDGETPVWATRGADRSIKYLADSVYFNVGDKLGEEEVADWQADLETYLGTGTSAARPIGIGTQDLADAEASETEAERQLDIVMASSAQKYFRLEKDVDLGTNKAGDSATSIYSAEFKGTLDGNGKKISYVINSASSVSFKGLIYTIAGSATVKNLIVDADITSTAGYQGLLVNDHFGIIDNCAIIGGYTNRGAYSAMIAATTYGSNRITNCVVVDESVAAGKNVSSMALGQGVIENIVYVGKGDISQATMPKGYTSNGWDTTATNVYAYNTLGLAAKGYGNKVTYYTANWDTNTVTSGVNIDTFAKVFASNEDFVLTESEGVVTLTFKGATIATGSTNDGVVSITDKAGLLAAFNGGESKYYSLDVNGLSLTSEDMNDAQKDQAFATFNGYLDGNGNTISIYRNFTIQTFNTGGVFKDMSGVIKDAKFVLSYDTVYNGSAYYSAFARNINGLLENCIFETTSDGDIHGYGNHGLAQVLNGSVINCVVYEPSGIARAIAKEFSATAVINGFEIVEPYNANGGTTYALMLPVTNNGASITNFLYVYNLERTGTDLLKVEAYNSGASALSCWTQFSGTVLTGFTFTADGIFFAAAE